MTADTPLPNWTKLAFHRCPNCNLSDAEEYCPAAVGLAQFLSRFETRISYEKAIVEVETPSRTIVSKTTFQHGIAGLIGLTMATSGCPRTRFLRPMARTHLPFASEEETVLRSLAFHLLAQYVAKSNGGAAVSLSLSQLKEDYGQLSMVNGAMAERIRSAIKRDAAINAVIILDSFTLIAPENIDSGFEDIRPFFVLEDDTAAIQD
ncbi:MAG: hypothetical protein K2X44_07930 [Magnetospirillum sp.]|nr:hypothetical protein [Magnetospirillum sp.]